MANDLDTNETSNGGGGGYPLQSFRVPKRNISINGIDRNKRPFNSRYHSKSIILKNSKDQTEIKEISDLMNSGLIKQIKYGSKNCFFTKELNDENREKFLNLTKNKSNDEAVNGWKVIECFNDGDDPCSEIKDYLEVYKSFEDTENKNCISMYGNVEIVVDFSKLKMLTSPTDGGILYPYGVIFFSDNKSFINQFSAKCAVLPSRIEKAKGNAYINMIDDWENVSVKGSFKTSGNFCIFYVNEEGIADDGDTEGDCDSECYPKVTLINIEVGLIRDHSGMIQKVGIRKASIINELATGKKNDGFGSQIDFLIKNMFSKHITSPVASNRFVCDYIYLVGDTPKYYDLSVFHENEDRRKNDNDNFSGEKPNKKNNKKYSKNTDKKSTKNKNKSNEDVLEETSNEKTNTQDKTEIESEKPVDVVSDVKTKEAENGDN